MGINKSRLQTLCNMVQVYQHFRGMLRLYHRVIPAGKGGSRILWKVYTLIKDYMTSPNNLQSPLENLKLSLIMGALIHMSLPFHRPTTKFSFERVILKLHNMVVPSLLACHSMQWQIKHLDRQYNKTSFSLEKNLAVCKWKSHVNSIVHNAKFG